VILFLFSFPLEEVDLFFFSFLAWNKVSDVWPLFFSFSGNGMDEEKNPPFPSLLMIIVRLSFPFFP